VQADHKKPGNLPIPGRGKNKRLKEIGIKKQMLMNK
jgi:hypothetical protein